MKARRINLPRIYPNENGWPIPPQELHLPHSHLDLEEIDSFNNHHSLWTERDFGRHIISLTCRNLSAYQDVIPRDTHNLLHRIYEPAPMPGVISMMERLERAFEERELLKVGSAQFPKFNVIDRRLWTQIKDEYTELKPDKQRIIIP